MYQTSTYYQASTFDIVLGIVIEVTLLVIEILLLRIFFRRFTRSYKDFEFTEPILGVRISAMLLILFSIPFLTFCIFVMGFTLFFTFYLGYPAAILFLMASILTIFGFLCLFNGIGLRNMNPTAWKGSIILISILTIYTLPYILFGPESVYRLPLIFYLEYPVNFFNSRLFWGLVFALGLGMLYYLFTNRDLYLSTRSSVNANLDLKITDQAKFFQDSSKCPSCGRLRDKNSIFCAFCGYTFEGEK